MNETKKKGMSITAIAAILGALILASGILLYGATMKSSATTTGETISGYLFFIGIGLLILSFIMYAIKPIFSKSDNNK